MRIRVFNDIHLFGVRPTHEFVDVVKAINDSPYPVLLNGDIVDIANCKYKDLPKAKQALDLLYDKAKKVGHVVSGNHECNKVAAPNEDYIDGANQILAAHGDIPCWGKERSDLFRNQTPGAGIFKRTASLIIDYLRHLKKDRPNSSEKSWIAEKQFENKGLRVCIFGHNHPREPIFFTVAGINCVVMPQGIHDIEIDEDFNIKVLASI